MHKKVLIGLALVMGMTFANASEINLAVASNFSAPAKKIAELYQQKTGVKINLSSAGTGVLYNQITNGAPFDMLFSADDTTTHKLAQNKLALESSNFTYANGQVVLWSANPKLVDKNGAILQKGNFTHLALANPKLAPYGVAGYSVLQYYKLLPKLESKIVTGDNISATWQQIASGSAELGFVALSQVSYQGKITSGSAWIVPTTIVPLIKQDAIILEHGRDNAAVSGFIKFVKTPEVKQILRDYGYQ